MNTTINSAVIDNTFYSIGFPMQDWATLIDRSNYITQIEDHNYKGIKILFIEGDDDSGKTTLCAQFAKKHSKQAISVFFNPLNSFDYTREFFCKNVVAQIKCILGEDPDIDGSKNIVEEYLNYLFKIRKLGKKNKRFALVIDGLEHKLLEDKELITDLLQLFPFAQETFNIIITGTRSDFLDNYPKIKREESKSIVLTGFSEPEMLQYLELQQPIKTEIRDLFKITKGFPGRLKTLKRLVENEQYSLDQITGSTTYKNWLELDCDQVNLEQSAIAGLVSLVALSDQSFTIEDVAKIYDLSLDDLELILKTIPILDTSTKSILFVSTAHKKYMANILRGNKKKIKELLINYYASNDSVKSLLELPKLYAESNEWAKIINVIDDNYISRVLENTESLQVVNERLELGINASKELNNYTDMWRYSLQGSVINELDGYLFWESEIKARISINDFAGAISVAESAIVKVDRLRLLALIARRQKELSKSVDEDLVKVIHELYNITDLSSVGEKIYDIVGDLIYAIPNLAIEIIEKSSGNSVDKNINDWIIAKLSVAAIDSNLREKQSPEKLRKLEAVQNLNYEVTKKINRAISFLVGNYSASRVLEEVKKLSDPNERIRLLRLWLNNNRKNIADLERVIDTALDQLIAISSEGSISFDVLKELSHQLPFIKNINAKRTLFRRFKLIEKNSVELGIKKNKYIYNLNMFHAELSLDNSKSTRTISKILSEIDAEEDLLIRIEAFSEVYVKLKRFKGSEFSDQLKFAHSRILNLSSTLYTITAQHFKISENILNTIANVNPILALKISEPINTESRREQARMLILDSYLDNNLKFIKDEFLKELEKNFEFPSTKDVFLIRVLERYADAKTLPNPVIQTLLYYTDKVSQIKDPSQKVFGYVLAYRIFAKSELWKKRLGAKIESNIYSSWKTIEKDWVRIDIGFNICSDIAEINQSFSKKIFDECEQLKATSWLDSSAIAYTYLNTLRLVIRSYTGLLASNNDSTKEYEILKDLIDRVPSKIEKLNLWSEVCLNAYILKSEEISRKILNNHILPLVDDLVAQNANIEQVLVVFTIIYLFNPELLVEYLNRLSASAKETALEIICDYFVRKRSPFEIYDNQDNKISATFSDLSKAISVLGDMTTDVSVYYNLRNICTAIIDNRSSFSSTQIDSFIDKLQELSKAKLPDAKNIKHEGYLILAEVKISRLKKDTLSNKQYWLDFIDRANRIPNKSDELYTKYYLLEDIPFEKLTNGHELRLKLYDEIIEILNTFNVHYEYVQRVIDISDGMYKVNKNKWKTVVNTAFTVSSNMENGGQAYEAQKNIIDSMYRLDSDYAKQLVKIADAGNRNNKIKHLLNDHFETLEITTKIKNNTSLAEKEKRNHQSIIRGVLSALAALNSDRITTKKIGEASSYLPIGSKLPLQEVFPIYMYYLGNCARTYKGKILEGALSTLHKDNFKEAVKAAELIPILSQRRKANDRTSRNFFVSDSFLSNDTIIPASREEAISYIKSWLYDEVEEFVIIADPYFQKEDIEILKIIKEVCNNIEIDILGSKDFNNASSQEYFDYWKKIADEAPPFVNFTFCCIPDLNNDTPFHDRWILTKNSGLRLGTSIKSLGGHKESEISIMKPNQALKIREDVILEYITRKKKDLNNQRISYKSFTF